MSEAIPLLSLHSFIVWTGTNLLLILLVSLRMSGDMPPLFHVHLWCAHDKWYLSLLTLRLLMSYIYGAPILDVSRSHTTTQHSR